jgi:hypothetical protein
MAEWATIAPIIVRIVTPRILDAISQHFRSTPENEKEKLSGILESLGNVIYSLAKKGEKRSKSETVQEIEKLLERVDSQDYQTTLGPDAADVVSDSLKMAIQEKRVDMLEILMQLRKLVNRWNHDLRFSGSLPST